MWVLFGCAVLCLGICLPLFFYYKPLRLPLAASFKSMGTLCALIPALIAALRLDPLYGLIAAAIAIQALADALLEFHFELGVGAFLLGHMCYILSFLKLYPIGPAHLVLLVGFLALIAYLLYRHRGLAGKNLLPFSVYGVVLSVMAASGIAGGTMVYGWQGILTAVGAALFFFSDGMLFRRMIFPNRPRHDLLIMITYYLAQLLLGGACLF